MHRSEKTDPTASERLVIFALPQKLTIIHKNGNFICRWREIMLDVSHLIPDPASTPTPLPLEGR